MARKQLGTPAVQPVDAVVKKDLDTSVASNSTLTAQTIAARNDAVAARLGAEAAELNTNGRLVRDVLGLRVVHASYSDEGSTGSPGTGSGAPGDLLTMGQVTTLTPGSTASATITGTSPNKVLNLAIPRGVQGLPGNDGVGSDGLDGADGDRITSVSVTTVAAGGNATVTLGGISPSRTLSFGVPRGAPGADGAKGASSAAETITWSTAAVSITQAQMENTLNITLTASVTALSLPPLAANVSQTVQLIITKASATNTITWPTTGTSRVYWTENAIKALSTTANSKDYFSLTWTGAIWVGSFVGKNLA